tara:strand:+ start:20 stop:856 length:837 start_codon:yes stop_codon:yes gene_type:complete
MKTLIQKAKKISTKLPKMKISSNKSVSQDLGDSKDNKKGSGEEFWDFREYRIGDPLKMIDWRKSSKSDKLFIKNNENESSKNVWFWVNKNVSMNFRNYSNLDTKYERALIIGLILVDIFLKSGEKVGVIGSELGLQKGQNKFIPIASELINKSTKLNETRIKKNDIVFIISDFLEKKDKIKNNLLGITKNSYLGLLIQVLDPAEKNFPFKGRNRFFDPVSGLHKLFNKSENMQNKYKNEVIIHQSKIYQMCSKFGWKFFTNTTNQSYESLILKIYNNI